MEKTRPAKKRNTKPWLIGIQGGGQHGGPGGGGGQPGAGGGVRLIRNIKLNTIKLILL
jgi:hypothetical protein